MRAASGSGGGRWRHWADPARHGWWRDVERHLHHRAAAGATSVDPIRHGCRRGGDGRQCVGGDEAVHPAADLCPTRVDLTMVGRIRRDDGYRDNPAWEGAASADLTWHGEARGRRIRPPLRTPRTRIRLRWCVSGVDAGGSTADPMVGDCGRQLRRQRIGPPLRAPRTRRRPPRQRVRTPKDMEEQRQTPP
ncbi:hypothetical protein OsJ_26437 [Oryza sativa Japonica Group]|uniref:Uncharacterized protein n=1 Tax=Oryza sativa subsp. japonica TaxID=39947 RepID=Q6YTN7_ORYSJ|nr:hypothetical protein OsJ_26437 [Oryza sativa Japonica Group]BAD03929.1 hypothetical protein [Oryza sativa Japonica Group]